MHHGFFGASVVSLSKGKQMTSLPILDGGFFERVCRNLFDPDSLAPGRSLTHSFPF